ncbi:MAG: hypothetical protein WBM44_31080 [Waterburya sp.]
MALKIIDQDFSTNCFNRLKEILRVVIERKSKVLQFFLSIYTQEMSLLAIAD